MAPPSMVPSLVRTLYFTAIRDSPYLVAMPNTPVSQHQSTAPGPPRAMAVPTPMIFPVPMVEARAVVRAANWLISPWESGSLVTDRRMPVKVLRWINPVRKVRKRWVPKRRPIMGMPQRQLLMPSTMLLTNSIMIPRFPAAAVFCEGYGFGVNNIN